MKSRTTALIVLCSFLLVGCGNLVGNLRRDLDDSEPYSQPTYGGRWSERGLLSQESEDPGSRYSSIGHSERSPASDEAGGQGSRGWVSPESAETNARDRYRWSQDEEGQPGVSMSNTPKLEPPVKRMYKNGNRATRADFIDDATNEGSLWGSDGQTNYYFTKNKVRGIGDLVTVTLEPEILKDVSAEVRRTLTPREREFELALAQERIKAKAMGMPDPDAKKEPGAPGTDQVATSQSATQRAPAAADAKKEEEKEKVIREATLADVDVSRSLDVKTGDTLMAEIVERYPNGNYKIRGTKRIQYKGGPPRMITLVGVARGQDITEEDTIASGKLYEYRIEASH